MRTVNFEWRKVGNEMHGYTVADDGRETHIFSVFKKESRFKRSNPWILHRVIGGGVEPFAKQRLAMAWAESLLEILR